MKNTKVNQKKSISEEPQQLLSKGQGQSSQRGNLELCAQILKMYLLVK